RGADVGQVAFFTLPHRPPAEFDGAIALLHQIATDALRLRRRVAEQDRRIGAKLLTKAAAEKLKDRPLRRLAENVPKRNLDGAHRLDGRALPAVEDRAFIHAMNEPVDLKRVLPNH